MGSVTSEISQLSLLWRLGGWVGGWVGGWLENWRVIPISAFNYVIVEVVAEIGNFWKT